MLMPQLLLPLVHMPHVAGVRGVQPQPHAKDCREKNRCGRKHCRVGPVAALAEEEARVAVVAGRQGSRDGLAGGFGGIAALFELWDDGVSGVGHRSVPNGPSACDGTAWWREARPLCLFSPAYDKLNGKCLTTTPGLLQPSHQQI